MPLERTGGVVVDRRSGVATFALRFRTEGKRHFVTLGSEDEGWSHDAAVAALARARAEPEAWLKAFKRLKGGKAAQERRMPRHPSILPCVSQCEVTYLGTASHSSSEILVHRRPARRVPLWWIYFVAAGYRRDDVIAVKIGKTSRPLRRRLNQIDEGLPGMNLYVIGAYRASQAEERRLHTAFDSLRIRPDREWFWWDCALESYALTQGWEGRSVILGTGRSMPDLVNAADRC